MLCLSTRAKLEIEDRFGSLENAFARMSSDNNRAITETTFSMLEIMMRAGAIYAKHLGEPCATPLTSDDLFDLVGISDIPDLVIALREAIINGVNREVEVEPSKNA